MQVLHIPSFANPPMPPIFGGMATGSTTVERIAEIETILTSGVKVDEVDGQRIEYDHASLRAELARLRQADPNSRARRPVASGIYLGGF